jgi:uncharacterized NAD-dependent epimerase/dehydratase family protein
MNLLAMLPSLLAGKTDIDAMAKSMGLIKRIVTASNMEGVLTKLCEDAAAPGMEVIEVTGVIGGKKIRCVLVADGSTKNLLKG